MWSALLQVTLLYQADPDGIANQTRHFVDARPVIRRPSISASNSALDFL
jgi:hypothetical protein